MIHKKLIMVAVMVFTLVGTATAQTTLHSDFSKALEKEKEAFIAEKDITITGDWRYAKQGDGIVMYDDTNNACMLAKSLEDYTRCIMEDRNILKVITHEENV